MEKPNDYTAEEQQDARLESRDLLLERYTVLVGRYQQQHRHLMDLLGNESVSAEWFAEAIDTLVSDLNQLKMTKLELSRRGREIARAAEGTPESS